MRLVLPCLALSLAVAACDGSDAPSMDEAAAAVAPPVVTFHGTDFAFSGPDTLAPGYTEIRFVNDGPSEHHMIVARLEAGKTMADIMAAFEADPNGIPVWMTFVGLANSVRTGGSTGSISDLKPGTHVAFCFIPSEDGAPHFVKGMAKVFEVAGEPTGAAAPEAVAEIRLKDFSFTVPTLTAGTHVFHIVNDGPELHEAQMIKLDEGQTLADFMATQVPGYTGEHVGHSIGGSGALSAGEDNYWPVTLEPGNYVLICFVPDAAGAPHFVQGMAQEVTVTN